MNLRMESTPGWDLTLEFFPVFTSALLPLPHPCPASRGSSLLGFFLFFQDPFGEKRGHFDYQALLLRLQGIRQRVQDKHQQESAEMDSESSSSEPETDTQGCSKA